MEPNYTTGNARKQRSPEEIIKLLEDYEKSDGISVREYCDMIGISDATFYNWQKKYGDGKEQGVDFLPLEIAQPSEAANAVQIEVRVIKFYAAVSAEQFKSLLS